MYDFIKENKKESFWEEIKYLFSWDSIKVMLNGGWDNEH